MKNILVGFIFGALVSAGAFMWIPNEKPQVTAICQEQEKIIERIVEEKNCPESIDEGKIEKAFLLFLASIGIKKDYANDVKSLVNNPESFNPPEKVTSEVKEEMVVQTEFFYPRDEALKTFNSGGVLREISDYYPKVRSTASYLLKDPAVYFSRSKEIDEIKKLRRINGVYIGKLYRLTGAHKGKIEDVEMNIEYWSKGKNEIDGKFTMTLARDGTIYSNMRGDGGNSHFYLNPRDPKELIIKAGPGMFFHFIQSGLENANVYYENSFIGVARLQKQ